jgi:hypothetical protein
VAAGALVRHSFFMKKTFIFELHNDWDQIVTKCNWYTFTFCYGYFEYDKIANTVEAVFILFGLGFRMRYCWDFANSTLGKELAKYEEERKNAETFNPLRRLQSRDKDQD